MDHVIPKVRQNAVLQRCFFCDHNVSELGIGLQAQHHGFKAKIELFVFTPAQRADAKSTAIDSQEVHSGGSDADWRERLRGQSDTGVCQTAARSPAEMETRVSVCGSKSVLQYNWR